MKQYLDVLRLVLEVTKNKRLNWKKINQDEYEATVSGEDKIEVRFLYPLLPDETTSGADIVHISVCGLGMTFFNGSEGMDMVLQILAAGIPEWIERFPEIIDRVSEKLRNLQS